METPKLRPYQEEDVKFLCKYNTAGCFNEQRTGKTPTALMCIKERKLENERILIIATVSSIYSWQQEYEKWVEKPCEVVDGTPKKKHKAIENWTNGLVISLGSIKETAASSGYLNEILKKKPTMVILDEAHQIRNTQTRAFNTIAKLRRIPYRLALTGTPAYGKQTDIYAILNFLFPDEFSSKYKFYETYFEPELISIWTGNGYKTHTEYNHFRPNKEKLLQNYLAIHCTQRKRKEVMQWLPEKDREVVRLPLTTQQEKALKELEETFETGEISTAGVLDRLMRFRQICVDPELLGIKSKSPKTEWILNYISENPDTPIIIFSNFTSYLWRLREILHEKHIKHAMIVGDVPPQTRARFQRDFQAGLFNVFLINIQAGKEALTLDRAEAIIFTDTYPPIGAIEQAEDRFIATTEEKKNKPHAIYNLVMKDSFDEHIVKLLHQRKTETEVLNDFKAQLKIKEEGL